MNLVSISFDHFFHVLYTYVQQMPGHIPNTHYWRYKRRSKNINQQMGIIIYM